MSDMVTTLHLAADVEGEYFGRNANFSGAGFAENTFDVEAVSQKEFDEWVEDVKIQSPELTEEEFTKLLEPGHLGRKTFSSTHLEFLPAPEHQHSAQEEDTSSEHENH